jgi:hypothetical protein
LSVTVAADMTVLLASAFEAAERTRWITSIPPAWKRRTMVWNSHSAPWLM